MKEEFIKDLQKKIIKKEFKEEQVVEEKHTPPKDRTRVDLKLRLMEKYQEFINIEESNGKAFTIIF